MVVVGMGELEQMQEVETELLNFASMRCHLVLSIEVVECWQLIFFG